MAHKHSANTIFYAQLTSSVASIIIVLILLIFHGVTSYRYLQQKPVSPVRRPGGCKYRLSCLLCCSFCIHIFGILYCVASASEAIWTEYISETEAVCHVHFLLLVNLYGLFKFSLYLTLCRKLVESFKDSVLYSYPRIFYTLWQLFLIVSTIAAIVACCAHIRATYEEHQYPHCSVYFPDILLLSLVVYDFVVGVINLVLFLRPLCRITATMYNQNNATKQRFKAVMYKNGILSTITIVTTTGVWIALYFAPGMEPFCHSFDIITTALCIVLLFKRNDWLYHILCCCFRPEYIEQPPASTELVKLTPR